MPTDPGTPTGLTIPIGGGPVAPSTEIRLPTQRDPWADGRVIPLHPRIAAILQASVVVIRGRAHVGRDLKTLVPLDPRVYDTQYYVDVATGADTNTGASWGQAFKSIWKATQAGNAAGVPFTVNIAPSGIYYRANGFSNNGTITAPTKTCVYRAVGGDVTCVVGDALTYTIDSGTTYKATRSNAKRVLDAAVLDADGDPTELTLVTSLAACQSTPGTWYTDGTTTWVNRADGAAVTSANTHVILQAVNGGIYATTSGNMHLYNVTQYGGNTGCLVLTGNQSGRFYAESCRFNFSATATYVDGVTSLDYDLAVFVRCTSSKNQKDGFNFHALNGTGPVPKAILLDCTGYRNGVGTQSISNNGATTHDGGVLLDLNGLYYGNYGGDFAHAGAGTLAVGIGTKALGGLSDKGRAGEVPDGIGFHATQGATVYKYDCAGGMDFETSGGSVLTK